MEPRLSTHGSIRNYRISTTFNEAEKLTYSQAVLILLSIAVGIGYVDVLKSSTKDSGMLIGIQLYCLITGLLSCYMLSQVKEAHQNKLGSYQEFAFYYMRDRSIILIICFTYGLLLISFSAFALKFSSEQLSWILCAFMGNLDESSLNWVFYSILLFITFAMVFPFSWYLNYQNFRLLTVILISSLALAFLFLIIQLIVCASDISKGQNSD